MTRKRSSNPRVVFVEAYEGRPEVREALRLVRANQRSVCGGGLAQARYRLAQLLGLSRPWTGSYETTPQAGETEFPIPAPYLYALRRVCTVSRKEELYPVVRLLLAREGG